MEAPHAVLINTSRWQTHVFDLTVQLQPPEQLQALSPHSAKNLTPRFFFGSTVTLKSYELFVFFIGLPRVCYSHVNEWSELFLPY